jgi:hypothetical protein
MGRSQRDKSQRASAHPRGCAGRALLSRQVVKSNQVESNRVESSPSRVESSRNVRRMMSILSITYLRQSSDVDGLKTSPDLQPAWRISCSERSI